LEERETSASRARFPKEIVRFCPQCGAPVITDARFCVECGCNLSALPSQSSARTPVVAESPRPKVRPAEAADQASLASGPFLGVLGAILVVGLTVAFVIMRQQPARNRLIASAPATPPASASAQERDQGQMPPGHPKVQLPKEALDFIAQTEAKAQANPGDLATWNRLGDVELRAAMFDPSYYPKAEDAYAHVLKADPENLNALRGIGNIDFDQRKYDQAIAAYEHYLSRKPDDPDVRTDLGTMYLSTGVGDQAIIQYKRVLETHPRFFEAAFNLAVAYSETNNAGNTRAALEKALQIAPDANARDRVNRLLASLDNPNNTAPAQDSATAANAPPISQGSNPSQAANAADTGTYRGAMEQMLHDLPIAGPKVQSVQWQSDTNLRVLMDNFPMDQMPPFAKAKFTTDLKSGIDQVKKSHQVSAPVEVDLSDGASGRVMQTVTE
jgi:tetratricopeptide (TPR) repeat protein